MIVCTSCGNKRCPHATDHRNACTGSNEPGQKGSSWENYPAVGSAKAVVPLTGPQLEGVIERHVGGNELSDDEHSSMVKFAESIVAKFCEVNGITTTSSLFDVRVNPDLPPDTMEFRDRQGKLVGKVVNVQPEPPAPSAAPKVRDLGFQLLAAANYIDTLGGDSRSYRQALAAHPTPDAANGGAQP